MAIFDERKDCARVKLVEKIAMPNSICIAKKYSHHTTQLFYELLDFRNRLYLFQHQRMLEYVSSNG
eukprot:scaffold45430_cov58-Attheya_sp.AAC.7